jgi:hypothetical protein
MCSCCDGAAQLEKTKKRRRTWELAGGWHCALIGTSLTLADLRGLARKLKVNTYTGFSRDYQLHGFFAKEAEKSDLPGKMLNKLLDKRHASAIRKVRACKTLDELWEFWDAASEIGDIPGPYWAILSHPLAANNLCEKMFADVHMLSHLVGASNRADIRRLQKMDENIAELEAKIAKQNTQNHKKLAEKNELIKELQGRLQTNLAVQEQKLKEALPKKSTCDCALIPDLKHKLAQISEEKETATAQIYKDKKIIRELQGLVNILQEETENLESEMMLEGASTGEICPFDLSGQCLLYVWRAATNSTSSALFSRRLEWPVYPSRWRY